MVDMVIVTDIGYVTVYPSQANPTPAISQTGPQPTSGVRKSTLASTMPSNTSVRTDSSAAHPTSTSPEVSMAHPSTTGLTPLPSGWPAPAKSTEAKPWDDSLAKLSLAGIIIMALILLGMIGYAIYQRFRGKCDKCAINEDKLRKWESGELKRITKDMVKARETLNSHALTAASDIDLEAGVVHDAEAERNAHRATALAALDRPRSVVQKPSLFERAKDALKQKGKKSTAPKSPEPVRKLAGPSYDRFFTVAEPITKSPPAPQPSHQPYVEDYINSTERLNRAYDPPTLKSPAQPESPTSIYSYDGGNADKVIVRPRSPTPERGVRSLSVDASVVSSALHIFDPRHRARYAEAQRKMEQGVVPDAELKKAVKDLNVIEAQMRGKRRSRGYGGLPDPEG